MSETKTKSPAVPMEFTLSAVAPVGPGQSAVAEVLPGAWFAADRALPVEGINYAAFEAQALLVCGRNQWARNHGRPLLEVLKVLRFASDMNNAFVPDSPLARQHAALPPEAPVRCDSGFAGSRIILGCRAMARASGRYAPSDPLTMRKLKRLRLFVVSKRTPDRQMFGL